jgi:hypothetical protein
MASSPSGLFARLPVELLSLLMKYLPITAVLSLQEATYHSLYIFETRTDPCQYLQDGPFSHPQDLLDTMWDHDALITGSQALNWFISLSTEMDSDWDVIVPATPAAVTAVKRALERSGVRFETCLNRVAKRIKRDASTQISPQEIISIADYALKYPHTAINDIEFEVIKIVLTTYPHLRSYESLHSINPIKIWLRNSGCSNPRKDQTYSYNTMDVLQGSAKKNGRLVKVQLIIVRLPLYLNRQQALLYYILHSYGSHTQCFLSRDIAVHLYYKLAVERKAYSWQVEKHVQKNADLGIEKYERRGFQFLEAKEERVIRNPFDEHAVFLQRGDNLRYSAFVEAVRDLSWSYCGRSISLHRGSAEVAANYELFHFGLFSFYQPLRDEIEEIN